MNNNFEPLVFSDKEKEKIQRLCYSKWEENDYKGIFTLSTGVGKSYLIYMALIKHQHRGRCFVIVPKVDLMHQIYDDIVDLCKIKSVGRIGDGYKEEGRNVTVAVINSIRDKMFVSELLCCDEFHRYFSENNSKFIKYGIHKRVMGLTATIEPNMLLKHNIRWPILHNITQAEAVEKNLISKFKVINIGVHLLPDEQKRYNAHDTIVKTDMKEFDYDIATIISTMKSSNDYEQRQLAMGVFRAIQGRKSIVSNSLSKLAKSIDIIRLNADKKIIVFCEYIKTADYIIKQLKQYKIVAGKFHSKMRNNDKKGILEKFQNNDITVIVSVKALDEGTNIPDCDMALIVGGNSVQKDILQRVGRVLRKTDNKDYAEVYQIYCKGTKDEDWTKKRTSYIINAASEVIWK